MSLNLDKSTWKRVRFADVVQNTNTTTKDPESLGIDRLVAMEHMDPGELQLKRWGDVADGTTFTRVVKPGQTLFGKRRAYQRKVAYADFEAVCSGDIYTFEATDGKLIPEFLPFLVQSDGFFKHALGTSAGSLSPRTNWRDLAGYEFFLPPLDEQRRLTDLLWAVEHHHRAVAEQRMVTLEASNYVVTSCLAALPEAVRLGDLTVIRSGPSFAASQVSQQEMDNAVRVLGIPNTKPDGKVDLTGAGYVTGIADSVGRINASSLVLIRTNGNRDRIGNTYMPPPEAHGYVVSAFQFLMQCANPDDREFLFIVLNEKGMQQRMSEGASGTVGLGNLAVRWLNEQQIPWSKSPFERRKIVKKVNRVMVAVQQLDKESVSLTKLRTSMLSQIFGGY